MYIPSHFKINDMETAYRIIHEYSFATLLSQHKGVPFATHLPLILDRERQFLYGHVARPNPQWKDIENQTILAIFQGPHSYISPSWYETHKAVPTWNYVTVHVYGEVVLTEERELIDSMFDMVKKYEDKNSTYKLEKIDANHLSGLAKGVQGFKIKITSLEAKAKLSQNHPMHRQELVIKKLQQSENTDDQKIAVWMKDNRIN